MMKLKNVMAMAKYYDIHNHLFNKDFLAKELLYRLMKELKKFLDVEEKRDRGVGDFVGGLKNVILALRRYSYAIGVFCGKNSTAVYKVLDKTYQGEFILTPLTFDLTYCFAPSADRTARAPSLPTVKEVFDKEMNTIFEMVEKKTKSLSRDFNAGARAEDDKLWKQYQKEKARFMKNAGKLQAQHEKNKARQVRRKGLLDFSDSFDGFEEQIRQILELKNDPAYRDMIFPFLAVDPRRPNIEMIARDNVGKGKPFIGVKLYCPNGYSPTDPLLFGPKDRKGGIYKFCEDNGIPVTAHNSDGGFATLSKSVMINGLVHIDGKLKNLDNELLTFNTSILDKNAINERAVKLNHPMIWEKVVEKYPRLILNLAHFGGGVQLGAALDEPGNKDLWSNRIIALVKDPRYNVYTDISCFSDFGILEKFVKSQVYKDIKTKVLYGSDFILLLLFENNFRKNVEKFKALFAEDFKIIAGSNPERFLKNVI